MKIKFAEDKDILIVSVLEDIVRENAEELEKLILEKFNSKTIKKVVLDIGEVIYINSYSLGVLVKIHQTLEENKKTLYFLNVNDTIKTLFKVTRVLGFFNIINDVSDIKN